MRINLGYDRHGQAVVWDTDRSAMLNIIGAEGTGKSTLIDRIMTQADRRMAVTRIDADNRPTPSPTIMTFTHRQTENVTDVLERVEAEQKRRAKGVDADMKPLMLVIDDFDRLLAEASHPTGDRDATERCKTILRTLSRILALARATGISLLRAEQSYETTRETLRRLVGQTCLCDAGSHIILGTAAIGDPIRPGNRDHASTLAAAISTDGVALPVGAGILQTNSGGIRDLRTPSPNEGI